MLARIRDELSHIEDVEEKRMFGSHAFMVRGKMCVTGRAERIMCRVGPAYHEKAIKRKGCRTVVMKGREYRGYVYVDAEAVQTKKALRSWIDKALEFNESIT